MARKRKQRRRAESVATVRQAYEAFKKADAWMEEKKADARVATKDREAALKNWVEATEESINPRPLYDAADGCNGTADYEAWRNVPLVEALHGLSMSLYQKLSDAELKTMGELSNYTNADGGRHRLIDIAGIGEKAAEKIEAAQEEFWRRWNAEHPPTGRQSESAPAGEAADPEEARDPTEGNYTLDSSRVPF